MRRTYVSLSLLLALCACSSDGPTADATDARPDARDVPTDTEDAAADGSADPTDAPSGTPDVELPPDPLTVSWCYRDFLARDPESPDYDQFDVTVGSHCLGTNHQDIQGVERLVFVGDSVTTGTPPWLEEVWYRSQVAAGVRERFGEDVVVDHYARFGARTDDLLQEPHQMLRVAFPEVEEERTLVVFTIGGNDIFAWASDWSDGESMESIHAQVDGAIAFLREALEFLADETRFPNGVYVIFSNVYEFTDATGDTASCEPAAAMGLGEPWPEGREPVVRFNEACAELASEFGFDLVFMLEHFCGHGYRSDDEDGQCYRGPDTERWFDFTCIHPNETGHGEIARMVLSVIDE